jgi:hypothetical protein
MLKKVFPFLIAFLISMSASQSSETSGKRVMLGESIYLIPEKYILPDFTPGMAPLNENTDDSAGILIRIPLQEIGLSIYSHSTDFKGIQIHAYDSKMLNSSSFGNPQAYDAWTGSGLYQERSVRFDQELRLYRVYPKRFPQIWNYFRNPPKGQIYSPSNWVASCMGDLSGNPIERFEIDCKTTVILEDIVYDITFPLVAIKQIDSIKRKILEKISEWKVA